MLITYTDNQSGLQFQVEVSETGLKITFPEGIPAARRDELTKAFVAQLELQGFNLEEVD